MLVDLHAQSRCNTGLKALVVAAGEAYAAVEEERQNPLVIIFVTGIGRRREDVGAAAVLYFQVLVTERHAHRPSLVEIVARFGSDRERIGFDAFRLVVPVAPIHKPFSCAEALLAAVKLAAAASSTIMIFFIFVAFLV